MHQAMRESIRLSNRVSCQLPPQLADAGARNSRTSPRHITDATKQLLKWASLTTVFSGLLGAGGLFGIDRLAESASNSRRSAQGLNLTIGEQKAFETEFGRVVDPDQFLSGVNDALTDVTKRRFLFGAGLTEGDLRGKDTAQVAAELLPHLKAIVDQTPQNQLQNVLHARGLDQFLTLQDAQRLKATPADQLQSWLKQYEADRRVFQPPPGVAKAWQDLTVQLGRAGQTIETTFIIGLARLAGPIGKLSAAVTEAIGSFLKSPQVGEWIDALAVGVKDFSAYLMSPAFKADVQGFEDSVGKLAHAIPTIGADLEILAGDLGTAIKWLGGLVKWFAEHPVLAGALGGAAAGGAVAGPVGAVVGGIAGGVAGSDATESDADAAWAAALQKWEHDRAVGKDKRSESQFEADYKKAHPGYVTPADRSAGWLEGIAKSVEHWLIPPAHAATGGQPGAPGEPGGGGLLGGAESIARSVEHWLIPSAQAATEPGGPPPQQGFGLAPLSVRDAFLNALGEGESKGDYNALYGGGSDKGLPTDAYGFPLWAGKTVLNPETGQWDQTHAAGKYQFEPGTWDKEAAKLHLHDFSPQSQDAAAWDLAQTDYKRRTGRDLATDLQAHNVDAEKIAAVLRKTWTSTNESFAQRLRQALSEIRPRQPQHAAQATPPAPARAPAQQASARQVHITVHNQTGGSAIITGSQLAT